MKAADAGARRRDKSALPNPFPGLRSFRSDEDYLFFGREEQALELVARLQRNRFIAVVGTSGQGKSSLVRCGLLSRLQGGGMVEAGAHWEIAVMHPGGDPFRHLAEALFDAGLYDATEENAVPQLLATLRRSQFGLVQAVRHAALPAGTNFLLVVDQFEEIFRYDEAGDAESEVANDFVAALREACAQTDVPIYVVTTMRSDFIGDCARFEGLAETVNRGEYLIPRLSREQFKSAIEGPIRVAGGEIAPRLLQRLLNDLSEEQDQLPCLQHALMRTWRGWQGRPGADALDLEDYAQVGKMSQALSVHADEVFHGFATERQRALCAALFKALTVEGSEKRGLRRPRRLQSLGRILDVEQAELIPVIDAFRHPDVSFLMPPSSVELRDSTVIDLSHESLMRVWARLRDWVDEEAKSVGIFRRLSESAALAREGKAGFYRDPELSIARAWVESSRPNAAWAAQYDGDFEAAMAFLEGSRLAAEAETREKEVARERELAQVRELAAAERRRAEEQAQFAARLKWLVRGLGLVAMVALTAMFLAFAARKEAQQNAELAWQNEQRATEHARVATAERQRADAQTEKFRKQIYKVQLLRADTALRQLNGGAALTFLRECEEPLRNWEWKRLAKLSDQSVKSLQPYPRFLYKIQFSPDGRQLLTTRWDQPGFKLYDVATGASTWEVEGPPVEVYWGPVPMSFSADGSQIAVRGPRTIELWDTASRRKIRELPNAPAFAELTFTADAQSLLAAHGEDRMIRLWNAVTGEVRKSATILARSITGRVMIAAFSKDGKTVLFGGNDGTIRRWDTESDGEPRSFAGPRGWLQSLGFSSDGKQFVSGDREGTVRLHDAESGAEIRMIDDRFKGEIRAIAFSPDGHLLAAAGGSTIKLWDTQSYEELAMLLGHQGDIASISFAPDSQTLATGDGAGTVKLWSTSQGSDLHLLRGHTGQLREVAFSPDGRVLASSGSDGTVRLWDAGTGLERRTIKAHRGWAAAVTFSPDGRLIASGGATDRLIRLWDGTSGARIHTLHGHTAGVFWVTFSPDGSVLLSAGPGGEAKLWDTKSGRLIRALVAPEGTSEGARFSPDGKLIATCGNTKVLVWDAASGELRKSFTATGYLRCVLFSPDGKSLAVGTSPNAIVWDLATGESRTFQAQGGRIQTLAWSPDGRRLFGAGERGILSVWDTASGDELLTMDADQGIIWGLQISPDGSTLATSGTTGVIRLWEIAHAAEDVSRKRRLINEAVRVLDEHSKGLLFASDLIAAVRAKPMLQPAVRDLAVQIAETRGDNPTALIASCQDTVRNLRADAAALALALRQAETAAVLQSDDPICQGLVALARYRNGKFAEAVEAANRAIQLSQEQSGEPDVAALVMKAIAQARLGAMDEAKELYAQAQTRFPANLAASANAELRFVARLADEALR